MRVLGTTMVLLGSFVAASGYAQESSTDSKDETAQAVGLSDVDSSFSSGVVAGRAPLVFKERLDVSTFQFTGTQIKFFEATTKLRDKYRTELIFALPSADRTRFTIKNSSPVNKTPVTDEQIQELIKLLDIDSRFLKVEKDEDGNPVIVINTNLEDRLPPELLKLTQGDFQTNMVGRIRELSQMKDTFGDDNFFKDALKAIDEKKAKLLFYDPYVIDAPIPTHRTMISAGALTYVTDPIEIHFNLQGLVSYVECLRKEDPTKQVNIENRFAGTIANELVHLMTDHEGIKSVSVQDINKEIEAMKNSDEPTENEKRFKQRAEEEVLSQLVDDIVCAKLDNPELEIDDKWLEEKFIDIYFTTITYFEVNYNVKLGDLKKEQTDEVFQSILQIIMNDDFQKGLKDGLKRFKLFDES